MRWGEVSREEAASKVCCVVSGVLVSNHSDSNWPNADINKILETQYSKYHLQNSLQSSLLSRHFPLLYSVGFNK